MIRTESLTKRFGDKVAVDNLNLDIAEGEFFCFLGPNGAGKTTTIKMLTGLMRPTAGTGSIGGFDIQTESIQAKQLLGYIPDHPFLYEKLTGNEFMHFVAGLYDMSKDNLDSQVADLMAIFELSEHADQLIERILFLEGLPNLQNLGKLRIGEDVPEILRCDLDMELDAIPDLRAGISYCENHKDYVTRELFDSILISEEEHVDWLETQIELISKVGLQNYQQSQT